jgi:hypothetical protein
MEREGDCIAYKENGCIEICLEKAADNNETMAL